MIAARNGERCRPSPAPVGLGFLPGDHQACRFAQRRPGAVPERSARRRPARSGAHARRGRELNRAQSDDIGDPEIRTRIEQYEMAYRMQSSGARARPTLRRARRALELYGPDAQARHLRRNCLMARRLVERGVRFVQIYHRGWDQHANLPRRPASQCRDVDQPATRCSRTSSSAASSTTPSSSGAASSAATPYCQGACPTQLRARPPPAAASPCGWPAAACKPGRPRRPPTTSATTSSEDPVSVHDLTPPILHLLGIEHDRLTFRHQGRDYRLTDVARRRRPRPCWPDPSLEDAPTQPPPCRWRDPPPPHLAALDSAGGGRL